MYPANGPIRSAIRALVAPHAVEAAASVTDEKDLLGAQLGVFCDPEDPEVRAQARADGIPEDWIEAARRSWSGRR